MEVRCKKCNKKLVLNFEGELEMYCPRCKTYNKFYSGYNSYALVTLDKKK